MGIPDEDVAHVRAGTDIVALIGAQAALRKEGRRWKGLCPFHAEKTPSFSVNAEEGIYYCFGCHATGDAITFVRETEHLDFVDAVRLLADRAGISIREDADGGGDRKKRTALFDAVEQAVAWYHDRLLSAKDAGPARDYLRSRGYGGEVVRQFRMGWAPDEWDALAVALKLPSQILTDSGLGFVNRAGRTQDAFRARIIFPICDSSGRPVALGGRILPPRPGGSEVRGGSELSGRRDVPARTEPKYKNSMETSIYSKRRTLYALNWAKHDIVASGEVVVCEGYTDVVGCFTAGVPRAVATCGTALGEEHFKLLRNFGKRIVLAYDADSAGQSAISRVYEWERSHEVEVAVARFPSGTDPGELAMRDPEGLRAAVAEARPFLQFRVDQVFAEGNFDTAEGRARTADAALMVVAEHPDALVKDQYVMQVADRCRVEPDRIRERLADAEHRVATKGPQVRSSRRPPTPTRRRGEAEGGEVAGPIGNDDPGWEPDQGTDSGVRPGGSGGSGRFHTSGEQRVHSGRSSVRAERPGMEALRLAVHDPDAVADRLDEVLFGDELQRAAFTVLAESESLRGAVESATPEVADLLSRIAVEEPLPPTSLFLDPVDAVISQLVRSASRLALIELQAGMRSSSGDLAVTASETVTVRHLLDDLDTPSASRAAEVQLVAWLKGRTSEGSGGQLHASEPGTGLQEAAVAVDPGPST